MAQVASEDAPVIPDKFLQEIAVMVNRVAELPNGEPVAFDLYSLFERLYDEPEVVGTAPRKPLQARETVYRGVHMRSRLEARYAAYLDAKGEAWEYEPLAFGGRGGQYLPDFRLAPINQTYPWYVEVRPTEERAQSALTQMLVIRESEPDAYLEIVIPDIGSWLNTPAKGTWEWTPETVG